MSDQAINAVLDLMRDGGWRLIDPAEGPAYLQLPNGTTQPLPAEIARGGAYLIRTTTPLETIQRGDPIIYALRPSVLPSQLSLFLDAPKEG